MGLLATSSSASSIPTFSVFRQSTSQKVIGQLRHPDHVPMINQKVGLFASHWFKDQLLALTTTDHEGKFVFSYDLRHWDFEKKHSVLFKVFEQTVPSEVGLKERMTDSISLSVPIQSTPSDMGVLYSRLYEAQENFPALEIKGISDFIHRPQKETFDYTRRIFFVGVLNRLKSIAASTLGMFSKELVQKTFPSKYPEIKATPEHTMEFLLNGMYPGYFRQGSALGEMVNVINWDKYDRDLTPDLPNTSLTLKKEGEKLLIKEVTVQYPNEKAESFSPTDQDFQRALYLYNSMALVKGEAVHHLGLGHLMTGQIALSFFRHIKNHPIGKLLRPHLDGVHEINRLGAGLIFGESGVLNVSGLTAKGVEDVMKDSLNSFDFATFQPREPLVPEHRFAYAQKLYWQIVTEVVDQFFEENDKEIKDDKNWCELFFMSQNLMKHSLPYCPFEKNQHGDEILWLDISEIDRPEVPERVVYQGHLRAIRPFISNLHQPAEGDIEKLKQFCRFTLFLSTFYHWALHSSQEKWGTNLAFGSLAPENRAKDLWGGTKPYNAAKQLEIANALVDFEVPSLVENCYGTIYQPFIDKLLKHQKEFKRLGYDITKMHYGVVI